MSKPVLLIDGLNAIHRANIVFGKQDETKASYTVVYNLFRSLKAMVERFEPEKIFFCLEGKNNFRYALYPNYKANRIVKYAANSLLQRSDFQRQQDIILDLLLRLPITQIQAPGFEADDVIGTLAEDLRDEKVIIVSNDTDYIQLLQQDLPNCQLYNPTKKSCVKAPAYHYVGWKCLRGDKSDNIPSLMSDSKAEKMIQEPLLLEAFLSKEENRAAFNLNRELIELKKVPAEILEFSEGELDLKYLRNRFESMEFYTMLTESYWQKFSAAFESL